MPHPRGCTPDSPPRGGGSRPAPATPRPWGAAKGTCSPVAVLNGARRRGVVPHLVVNLQPVALRVRYDHPTVPLIEDDGRRIREAPFTLQAAHFTTPFHGVRARRQRQLGRFGEFLGIADKTGDKLAIRTEDLHAVVGPVTHIHIALRVDSDVSGTIQLPPAGPKPTAELHDELTIRGELRHPVVFMVGDVHVPFLVYGQAPGGVELTRGAAKAAPLAQELAVLGECLYAMVAAVDDIQDILLVDGDS